MTEKKNGKLSRNLCGSSSTREKLVFRPTRASAKIPRRNIFSAHGGLLWWFDNCRIGKRLHYQQYIYAQQDVLKCCCREAHSAEAIPWHPMFCTFCRVPPKGDTTVGKLSHLRLPQTTDGWPYCKNLIHEMRSLAHGLPRTHIRLTVSNHVCTGVPRPVSANAGTLRCAHQNPTLYP